MGFRSRILGLALCAVVGAAAVAACGDDGDRPNESPDGGNESDASDDAKGPPTPAEFGLDTRPSNPTCKAPARPPNTAPVKFEQVYANVALAGPMMLAQRPGDGSRWYVVLRAGGIAYFTAQNPGNTPTVAADISNGTLAGAPGLALDGEGGLFGMAFHPKFAQNGKVFISFTGPPRGNPTEPDSKMRSFIAELTSTNNGDTFTTYKTILEFDQPLATNHKGGGIVFGNDGFLYVGFGDGGSSFDAYAKGQTKDGFFSKVLRIDVDNPAAGKQYGIPSDNPFKNGGGAPETFARGFRNPFRISIDRESGQLWVGDVGQNAWEEIDHAKAGGNYGWPCREGAHDTPVTGIPERCPDKTNLLDPILEHQHAFVGHRSITGGVVYRGKAIAALVGSYVYGDYQAQELFAAAHDPATGAWTSKLLNETTPRASWAAFSEDIDGEVYATALNQGQIYKLVANGPQPADTFPTLLTKTGCVDSADAKKPASGLVPYAVNAQLWSDGAEKERFIALPDGQAIGVGTDGDFDLPIGSVVVKSFKIGGKYIETRLLVRHDDGGWAGYTYEWNDAQTDATLLRGSKTKQVGAQAWYFPSRGDCARCHTDAAGKTLGLELGQLNGDFVYASTNRISNQLKTLDHIGMFTAPLGKQPAELALIPPPDGTASLEARARAYLHANCGQCHRPKGGGAGNLDLRFTTSLKDTASCNVVGERGDVGVPGAKLVVPSEPLKSIVSIRTRASGANRMPPLASSVVDEKGIAVVDDWIKSLAACP